jgi:ABC-type branched-subunit amino acid transport system substrate-binding protein
VAAAVAGCTGTGTGSSSSSSSSVLAKGQTLVVYLSEPATPDPVQQQVVEAEQLGCRQLAGAISGTSRSVKCELLRRGELSNNARAAIQDESAIAYVGELEPGTSQQTVGITNALDLLELSPTDTAVELTQATAAVPGAPDSFYETAGTYGRTFARLAPTSAEEATAQATEMKALGVHSLYIATQPGNDYGRALAAALRQAAAAASISVTATDSGAEALFYAGNSASGAGRFATAAAGSAPHARLFLPSAFAGLAFGSGPWSSFRAVYVSAPAPAAGADSSFVSRFRSRYGTAPAPEAAFGYAAIEAIMHVLREAGKSANDRTTVVHDFDAKLKRFSSAVGTISIDADGNSSLGASSFRFSRLRDGTLVALHSS